MKMDTIIEDHLIHNKDDPYYEFRQVELMDYRGIVFHIIPEPPNNDKSNPIKFIEKSNRSFHYIIHHDTMRIYECISLDRGAIGNRLSEYNLRCYRTFGRKFCPYTVRDSNQIPALSPDNAAISIAVVFDISKPIKPQMISLSCRLVAHVIKFMNSKM